MDSGVRPVVEIAAGAIIKYNVSFDSQGGSSVSSMKVGSGKKIGTLPTEPIRENYAFGGWYTDNNYTDEVTKNTIITENVTYYAKWVELQSRGNMIYADMDDDNEISLGDYVRIGDNDEFWVIDEPSDGKIKLLSKYNLNLSYRQEKSSYYPFVRYSISAYWWDDSAKKYRDGYNIDKYDNAYVYEPHMNRGIVSTYITNYKDYLTDLGLLDIKKIGLMSYEEAVKVGCLKNDNSCPTYISNQEYWLGSVYRNLPWYISPSGSMKSATGGVSMCYSGVRPLIEIDESLLANHYNITFDSQNGEDVTIVQITPGESLQSLPSEPTRNHWTFEGWYTDKDYTVEVTEEMLPIAPTRSTTYYAKWSLIKYSDSDDSGTINLGDYVKIGDDGFWVIASPSDGEVKLLAEYNLNSNYRQVSSNYVSVDFAPTQYWWDSVNNRVYNNYSRDIDGISYIYRTSAGAETQNYLVSYINNYKNYLKNDFGVGNMILDARLMSYMEAVGTGCQHDVVNSCPLFVANQNYHLGSSGEGVIGYAHWWVNNNDYSIIVDSVNFSNYGVRPLIIINESALTGE